MKADTVLTLGDFAFARLEIPEKIAFGGAQKLVTHELVGGVRVVDAMGREDVPLEWSGMFTGANALARARYLDGLRIAGKPLTLTWDEFLYTVVIRSFTADFERFYQIPYRISCLVVADGTSPQTSIASAGIDSLLADDLAAAKVLAAKIGDGPTPAAALKPGQKDTTLSGLMGTLDSAIKKVSDFSKATQSQINSVLQPLADVRARVKVLTASVGNLVTNVATLGGVLPNNPIAKNAAKLTEKAASFTQLPQLYNLDAVLGRMGGNIGNIGGGDKTVTTAGGNLYGVAAKQYGDATAWPGIAKANNLTDPQITGVKTLTIPATPDNSGGVLRA